MSRIDAYGRETVRYIVGALLAGVTTIIVYLAAANHWFASNSDLALFALALAAVQLVIQLISFLHLDSEAKPRWQLHSFWFIFVMAVVIVVGSIWIMMNLDYNMGMTSHQMEEYMMKQNKKGF